MGEPVRIADLAHHLITMAGFVPNLEIPIVYTGLRPGEKLHEELMTEEEERTTRARDRILTAQSPAPPADLQDRLAALRKLADAGDVEKLLLAMRQLVPSFRTPEHDEGAAGVAASAAAQPATQAGTETAGRPSFPVPPARAEAVCCDLAPERCRSMSGCSASLAPA
jgi:hypothetical protein